ncbi:CHAT domain-containing protein [Nocardia speluncae]|uniref:CHAT domain-containing protein n=1 Tax=Nocardia speluncae TaxID=419477 RepID=A0A846XLL8_9NOCA|nr:CHAT domain-containing tetratricopeptide repeat protein [Nocardia speluncae]NKY37231.1 CHAT domain-containing protein [Nocardia speluncae]
MSFDELLQRIQQRVADFWRSRQAETVLGDAVQAEITELAQAALPADPDHPTPEESHCQAAASLALGWLHFMRSNALPNGMGLPELARTIAFLGLWAEEAEAIPEQLRTILGPGAEASDQAALAADMLKHAETTADPILLNVCISLHTEALAAAPAEHLDQTAVRANLGIAYLTRFEREGMVADVDRAIDLAEHAIAATPIEHHNWAGLQSNLGNACRVRFEHVGAAADLNRAIKVGEKAVTATPTDDPELASRLSNLGIAYMARFRRFGVTADLNCAIKMGEKAVTATPTDDPERARRLSNLGNAYMGRFERGGATADPADLDHAIGVYAQAVTATVDNHPNRAGRLSNLCDAYMARYKLDGDTDDLNGAIDAGVRAVAAAPIGHPHHARFLHNLGVAHLGLFACDGVAVDLELAIGLIEKARTATVPDHPDRARILSSLGVAYMARFSAGRQGVDRETLYDLAEQVGAAVTASPVGRILAGGAVGSLASAMNEHALAVELLDAAVALMPSTAPRESDWEDQEHRLGKLPGLVGEAIAAHCAIDDPAGAVEIAELGRGMLLAAQLDARTDLSDLDRVLPDLAARLRQVRDLLNTPHSRDGAPNESPAKGTVSIEDRRHWWNEHDQLITQIRRHPGLDRFQRPPNLTDLQPAPDDGDFVIMVNTAQHRSDAIVLGLHTGPVPVRLPDLSRADVEAHAGALLQASYGPVLAGILQRQRVVPEILAWLWDAIVHPVLQATLLTGSEGSLPRVWWLPTGLLGLFPLHAAGHTRRPGALDTMISSYTPTLRALAHARTRPPAAARRQLTVALHHTPGLPDLPGTFVEATTLHTHHPDTPLLLDDTATTDRVLAALPNATWAHFATHASVDFTAPSRGGLHLHNGTLSLPEISQLRLTHAELAYLSACSTANRGTSHADESLHPASAFQLAGFRHVIASLWPLADHIAATAATTFYRQLPPSPTVDHAATALHRTTCDLRAQHPTRPDLWAALIHSGP